MDLTLRCIFAIFAVPVLKANALDQHFVCKNVDDVFTDPVSASHRHATRFQGRAGKRGAVGPRGVPGPRGLKGEAGNVNYTNISELVEKKIEEGLEAIIDQLKELQQNISELQRNMTQEASCGSSGLQYKGVCYITPLFSTYQNVTRSIAGKACREINYRMAEIHDQTQQERLEEFIRSKISGSSSSAHVWVGMTYVPSTGSLRYESGKTIPGSRLTWWRSYPQTPNTHVYVVLGVRKTGRDGIWNSPGNPFHGVICEKKM